MKFYEIALFLLIIQLFGGFLWNFAQSDLGFTGGVKFYNDRTYDISQIQNQTKGALSTDEVSGEDPVSYVLGLSYKAVTKVVNAVMTPLEKYILWIPMMLVTFGVPESFALMVGAVTLFVEGIGLAQFILGRSLKEVE
jgi:hypothetical protein